MAHNLDIIDELHKTLKQLQPLKPEDQKRLNKKFRLEFNYNSNHIEGNTLTYGETELLLMFEETIGSHNKREYDEMQAHDAAYQLVGDWSQDKERTLTEQDIKQLDEIILVRPYWKEAITPDGQSTRRQIKVGSYKEQPNSVRLQNGEMFNYASPTDTPILMQELIDWYRNQVDSLNPIALATMLHYKFVRIHPFDDGNGRIARLLMNYVLLRFDYPPVIIKSSDKNNYLRVLHLADVGDYEPLIEYVTQQLIWSLETSIKAAKGESLEDADDFKKEIELIKRRISNHGVVKSPSIIFEVIKATYTEVWMTLFDTLSHFDSLFNECLNRFFINGSVAQGNDVVETEDQFWAIISHMKPINIHDIGFMHNMVQLHVEEQINFTIFLKMSLNIFNYRLQLTVNKITICDESIAYNERLSETILNNFNTILKDSLLKSIKDKIN